MYKLINLENNIIGDYMIREIMTYNIISSSKDNTIKDVSVLMKENNIGFIPIKDEDEYIGVITDRDICLALPTINNVNDSSYVFLLLKVIFYNIFVLTNKVCVYKFTAN
jgi:predicted transcriptional regulator